MLVAGLDISTKTGLVILDLDSGDPVMVTELTAPMYTGLPRASVLVEGMLKAFVPHKPILVVTEGYGYANTNTLALLVEIGTVFRYFLMQEEYPTVIVAPTSLKKFVTGNGGSPKEKMALEIFKRWGFEHKSNNVLDAYGLAQWGRVHSGVEYKFTKDEIKMVERAKKDSQLIAKTP